MSDQACTCVPHPYGSGPEVDCPVHGLPADTTPLQQLEARIIMELVDGCASKQHDGDLTHPVMVSVSEAAHILAEWFAADVAAAEARVAEKIATEIERSAPPSCWCYAAIQGAAALARSVTGKVEGPEAVCCARHAVKCYTPADPRYCCINCPDHWVHKVEYRGAS